MCLNINLASILIFFLPGPSHHCFVPGPLPVGHNLHYVRIYVENFFFGTFIPKKCINQIYAEYKLQPPPYWHVYHRSQLFQYLFNTCTKALVINKSDIYRCSESIFCMYWFCVAFLITERYHRQYKSSNPIVPPLACFFLQIFQKLYFMIDFTYFFINLSL